MYLIIRFNFCLSFLQLLFGGSDAELRQRNLSKTCESYFYTKQGGVSKVSGINDQNDFKQVNNALKVLGLQANEITATWDQVKKYYIITPNPLKQAKPRVYF